LNEPLIILINGIELKALDRHAHHAKLNKEITYYSHYPSIEDLREKAKKESPSLPSNIWMEAAMKMSIFIKIQQKYGR
jgi:hypothetical protein